MVAQQNITYNRLIPTKQRVCSQSKGVEMHTHVSQKRGESSDQSALHLVVLIIAIFLSLFVLLLLRILILIAIEVHHGILLILILGDQIAHILIGLLELHLVHALALISMQERLALIHFRELRADALENALNRRGIRHEGAAHRRTLGRNSDDT